MINYNYRSLIFLLICLSLTTLAAQNGPRLIVRGDDMGFSHACNLASIESYEKGIETSIEVIVPSPWFPEAVQLLKEYPNVDVGIHLALTSEWDNVKWRPLTHCPSLIDENGYFLPMIWPHKSYPGLAIRERDWKLEEIEQEFRAQIEMALRNIPQISHFSGHMGCTRFDPKVAELAQRLAKEYHLIDLGDPNLGLGRMRYDGPKHTAQQKVESFIKGLDKLENGKVYQFVDHPAYDNVEMQAIYHMGYEDVAADRQGVTELLTNEKVKAAIKERHIQLVNYHEAFSLLPRSTPEAEGVKAKNFEKYLEAVEEAGQELHSLMVLRHGKVIFEKWLGEHGPTIPHVMHSVSKSFTATAIGFAVQEKLLKVSDKVIEYFPDELPEEVSPYLKQLEIRHLLTMTVGHDTDPTRPIRQNEDNWERAFLAFPIKHEPGKKFVYNSMATYMLSAIIQKVTDEKVIDYLYPRLFRKLGINGINWQESPSDVNTGGWGLFLKTEDMAKMGQFMLQQGKWEGEQLLPVSWFEEATTAFTKQPPVWVKEDADFSKSDWVQGYGYQLWRCRHNAFRADGAVGQFIIVLPEQNAVIVTTANINNMQAEINLIWKYLLKAMK